MLGAVSFPVTREPRRHTEPTNQRPMGYQDRDYMRQPRRSALEVLSRLNALHIIIGINVAVFIIQHVFEKGVNMGGVSVDALASGQFWTAITYMFVHDDLLHIGCNMLMIYFAGSHVIKLLDSRHFLNLYFLSGLAGAALELTLKAYLVPGGSGVVIGASASAMGLLIALAVMLPAEVITTYLYFIFPVNVRMWTLARFLMILSLALGVISLIFPQGAFLPPIAHFAHLGGALMGWYYMRLIGYGGRQYERLLRERRGRAFGRQPEFARARRRKLAEDLDLPEAPKPRNVVRDVIRDEIDPILDKANEQGWSSLTDDERRTLERASREIKRRK